MRMVLSAILAGIGVAQQLITPSPAFPSGNEPHERVAWKKIGQEARVAWMFTPEAPRPRSAPVVLFLHGYGGRNPYYYAGWIEHLVRTGNIVIYPAYQESAAKRPAEWREMRSAALRQLLRISNGTVL